MSKSTIAGRIAGAAVAGALLLAGPAVATLTAGTASADAGTATELTPEEQATLQENLDFDLNPFSDRAIDGFFHKIWTTDFFAH